MDVNLITAVSAAAGAVLSGVATTIAIIVAYKVHQNQKLLSQRQLLLPLWDYMATLSKIDSNTPVTPDVIKVVNTLELVALCCEGGMIDEKVIRRTFKDQFIMADLAYRPQMAVADLVVDTTCASIWATPEIVQILDKVAEADQKKIGVKCV